MQFFFHIAYIFSDNYKKFLPKDFGAPGLSGFGYSFSNVESPGNNKMPFFAIGAVNDDIDHRKDVVDKIVLFDFFCLNLKCRSSVISPKTVKKDEGKSY